VRDLPQMATSRLGETNAQVEPRKIRTLQDLNQRNQEVWFERSRLMAVHLSDIDVARVAFKDVISMQYLPLEFQKTYEQSVEFAAYARDCFRTGFAREAGRAAKADALQELILESVLKNPRLTEKELLRIFHENKSGSIIWDIDEQFVYFKSKGKDKQASISGLKDRLARAKKKIVS
jgi:hypothetical protein